MSEPGRNQATRITSKDVVWPIFFDMLLKERGTVQLKCIMRKMQNHRVFDHWKKKPGDRALIGCDLLWVSERVQMKGRRLGYQ